MKPCPYCNREYDERGLNNHIKKCAKEFEKISSSAECGSVRSGSSTTRGNGSFKAKQAGGFHDKCEKRRCQSYYDKRNFHDGAMGYSREEKEAPRTVSQQGNYHRHSRDGQSREKLHTPSHSRENSYVSNGNHSGQTGQRKQQSNSSDGHQTVPKTPRSADHRGKMTHGDKFYDSTTSEHVKAGNKEARGSAHVDKDKTVPKQRLESSHLRQNKTGQGNEGFGNHDDSTRRKQQGCHSGHTYKNNDVKPSKSKVESKSTSAEESGYCGFCERPFRTVHGLKIHWSKKHSDVPKSSPNFIVLVSETANVKREPMKIHVPALQGACYNDSNDKVMYNRSSDGPQGAFHIDIKDPVLSRRSSGASSASGSSAYLKSSQFECDYCEICFANDYELGIHVGQKHTPDETEVKVPELINPLSNKKELSKLMVDLKLPKDEVSDASEYINKFVDCFKEELQSKAPSGLCLDEFRSGSYYDKTKIGSPDEFDIMFYPSNINWKAEFDDHLPGYCKIKIQGQPPPEYRDLVTKDGYLNPWKFKDKLFKLFSECIRSASFRPGRRTKRTERPPESPAFTVLFDTVPGKQPIDIDLVPSVQIQGWPKVARKIKPHWLKKEHAKHAMKMYHAVAKSCPYDVPNKELYWRISFSHAEKILVKYANNGNGNSRRKDIFRIMKQLKHYVKEQNPDKIEKFCSYHLKMFMLNEFDSWRGEVSNQDDLLMLVLETVYRLTRCLQRSTILNYFIRNDNILKFVPHGELDLVCKSFEKYNSSS